MVQSGKFFLRTLFEFIEKLLISTGKWNYPKRPASVGLHLKKVEWIQQGQPFVKPCVTHLSLCTKQKLQKLHSPGVALAKPFRKLSALEDKLPLDSSTLPFL